VAEHQACILDQPRSVTDPDLVGRGIVLHFLRGIEVVLP
jgi:hypothetical protein